MQSKLQKELISEMSDYCENINISRENKDIFEFYNDRIKKNSIQLELPNDHYNIFDMYLNSRKYIMKIKEYDHFISEYISLSILKKFKLIDYSFFSFKYVNNKDKLKYGIAIEFNENLIKVNKIIKKSPFDELHKKDLYDLFDNDSLEILIAVDKILNNKDRSLQNIFIDKNTKKFLLYDFDCCEILGLKFPRINKRIKKIQEE